MGTLSKALMMTPRSESAGLRFALHLAHRAHEVVGALHRVQARVHRDHQVARRGQGVHREHAEGRRGVQEDEVEGAEMRSPQGASRSRV